MLKIGITGSMGSGKTTVAQMFSHLGVPVYNADERAKYLMKHSDELVASIKLLFGTEAYLADHELNRKWISDKAFNDPTLLTQLNQLVHPAVYKDFDDWCRENSSSTYVMKEAALMFESESYKQLDEIIVVTCPEEMRIERAMQRDNQPREAIISRMKNQMTETEKLSRGDYEITNDEEHLLIPQVLELHRKFSH